MRLTVLGPPAGDGAPSARHRDPFEFRQTDGLHMRIEHQPCGCVCTQFNDSNVIAVRSALPEIRMQFNLLHTECTLVLVALRQIMIANNETNVMLFGGLIE